MHIYVPNLNVQSHAGYGLHTYMYAYVHTVAIGSRVVEQVVEQTIV